MEVDKLGECSAFPGADTKLSLCWVLMQRQRCGACDYYASLIVFFRVSQYKAAGVVAAGGQS